MTYHTDNSTFTLKDRLADAVDVVGVNKYMGWYMPFPVEPEKIMWDVAADKPLVMTEFGGEALYGQDGADDVAHSWSEEYQEEIYRQNYTMFRNIPNLRGTAPWVLFDFRSPYRCHQRNQEGWNRKGLVSDKGRRKKAWWVVKEFYETSCAMDSQNRRTHPHLEVTLDRSSEPHSGLVSRSVVCD